MKPDGTTAGTAALPTEDQIRVRAYELFLARGNGPGDPEGDWLQAERELRRAPGAQVEASPAADGGKPKAQRLRTTTKRRAQSPA